MSLCTWVESSTVIVSHFFIFNSALFARKSKPCIDRKCCNKNINNNPRLLDMLGGHGGYLPAETDNYVNIHNK